ncbi:hypothetical protein L9F63_005930, partial [Diploptera punctata]
LQVTNIGFYIGKNEVLPSHRNKMACKVGFLFLALLFSFSHAKEARGLFSSAVTTGSNNNKENVTEVFLNITQKSIDAIKSSIAQADSYTSELKNKIEENVEAFNSDFEEEVLKARETVREAAKEAIVRGADVTQCISDFTSNMSAISESSGSEFQDCSAPYVSSVVNTTSRLRELNSTSVTLYPVTAANCVLCLLDVMCHIKAVENAAMMQTKINADIASYMQDLGSEALVAQDSISSCADASYSSASEEIQQIVQDALEMSSKCLDFV